MNPRRHQRGAAGGPPSGRARAWVVALPLGLGLALGLAGCGSLLPRPAPALAQFTLEGADSKAAPAAARAAAAVPCRGAPTLMVDEPRAAPGYDSARMVYQRQPQRLQAFAFHAWVAPPARMLAPLLQRALQATGAFRAVVLAPSAASGACRLETTLVRLVQDFGTHPSQVRLTLRAVLLDSASGRVLAADEFDQREPAASDDPAGGAAAARAAADRVAAAVAARVAQGCTAVPPTATGPTP